MIDLDYDLRKHFGDRKPFKAGQKVVLLVAMNENGESCVMENAAANPDKLVLGLDTLKEQFEYIEELRE